MQRGVRLSVVTLAMGLVATMPMTALAEERSGTRDRVETDQVVDRAPDVALDRPSDQAVDEATYGAKDTATDVRPVRDLRPDRHIDREVDRVTDRCHPRIVDNVRRCLNDDRPHDIDVRHLIWRLIKAHEWEKLVRLLHWLGWL